MVFEEDGGVVLLVMEEMKLGRSWEGSSPATRWLAGGWGFGPLLEEKKKKEKRMKEKKGKRKEKEKGRRERVMVMGM